MERIGEYLVRRLVGEGGMGKVYEAEERLSKRRVALKVLRPELTRHEEGRRLFLNEMQILAHLEHPNVVRSLACVEVDGQLVMALEYLEGRTLRQELTARGRLPWAEAVDVAVQIAEGLQVAHAQEPPIVHRDLKPENVMLPESGPLKVMDFGIAKVLEAAHATNTQSIGTLQYMSPEQIDAVAIDARSDLYALGLILYEMLSGRPPFTSASPRELLNMQCTASPAPLPDDVEVPQGVEDVMFALLAKAPAERPATASEVAQRLAPFRPARGRGGRARTAATRQTVPGGSGALAAAAGVASGGQGGARASTPGAHGNAALAGHAGEGNPGGSAFAGNAGVGAPAGPGGASAGAGHTPPYGGAGATAHSAGAYHGSAPPAAGPSAAGPSTAAGGPAGGARAPRHDTLALVERATDPREMSTGLALLLIVALSLVAGLATYVIRARTWSAPDAPASATASAGRRPAP